MADAQDMLAVLDYFHVSRFKVQGFKVQGSGFRVQGFKVQGSRFRGSGFRVQSSKVQRFRDSRFWAQRSDGSAFSLLFSYTHNYQKMLRLH